MRRLRASALIVAALALLAATACSRAEPAPQAPAAPHRRRTPAAELRLGYFPNVTHAPAIIGVEQGLFTAELGATKLTTQTFNAGGDAVNALLGGSLDATYIGSGPAINAFAKSDGQAVRLIAGATSGGAQLVVKPEITAPEQLKGKTIATPQLGNTQDIALKKWLIEQRADRRRRPGRGEDRQPGQPAHPGRVQAGHRGRRLAARAVELPAGAGGRRERAGRRGHAVAERQVPDHGAAGAHRVPQPAPGHRAGPAARAPEGHRRGRGQAGRGQGAGQPGPAEAHRQGRWTVR